MSHKGWTRCAMLMATVLLGCGSAPLAVPVEGRVHIAGKPAEEVSVVFIPDSARNAHPWRAHGATDDSGHFTLQCEDGRTGAVPGHYRVILDDLKVYANPRNDVPPQERKTALVTSRIPPAYRQIGATPLQVEVLPEQSEFILEVKP